MCKCWTRCRKCARDACCRQLSKMNRQPWLTADAADACRLPLHCKYRVQYTHLRFGFNAQDREHSGPCAVSAPAWCAAP